MLHMLMVVLLLRVGLFLTLKGLDTTASGTDSHAEGSNTTASGDRSHAEGASTTASGDRISR